MAVPRKIFSTLSKKPSLATFLCRTTPTITSHRNQYLPKSIYNNRQSKVLFTPGPLMVSDRVKEAMIPDICTRHVDFEYVVQYVRSALLKIAQVNPKIYTAIPIQGSGTVATEATIRTLFGRDSGTVIVVENGTYGQRIADICRMSRLDIRQVPMNLDKLQSTLASVKNIAGVIAVHCETGTGLMNPIETIGKIVKGKNDGSIPYVVDAMASFGAIPISMRNIDVLITTACKSLQGVPGISCIIARKDLMERRRGKCSSLTLDLAAQYDCLEEYCQFRFTAPTHVMLGFREALQEYDDEGGLPKRMERYRENCTILKQKMTALGFTQLYRDEENPNGYFVTAFKFPNSTRFVFNDFYERLSDEGKVICPLSDKLASYFRISTIGDLKSDDVRQLIGSVKKVCREMKVNLPQQPK